MLGAELNVILSVGLPYIQSIVLTQQKKAGVLTLRRITLPSTLAADISHWRVKYSQGSTNSEDAGETTCQATRVSQWYQS